MYRQIPEKPNWNRVTVRSEWQETKKAMHHCMALRTVIKFLSDY
jgi:hypothetical protein